MSSAIHSARDSAIDNWNHALQTYRASIDLYARVVKIQQRRGARRFPIVTSVPAPAERAPSPASILDALTPREREVALLIARGLSNRQIAQQLVIAQGTAANHVAHIIGKLGLTNRVGIAAAVASGTEALDTLSDFERMPSLSLSGATLNGDRGAPFVRLSNAAQAAPDGAPTLRDLRLAAALRHSPYQADGRASSRSDERRNGRGVDAASPGRWLRE